MPNPAIDIPNLLYRYADAIDAGDFENAAALFAHGHLIAEGQRLETPASMAQMWRDWVIVYPGGTPRTRHLTTNPMIDVSDDGQTASCRSQWTVLQATDDLALQIIATGRYHDRFAIIDGRWCFTERNYAQIDLLGDVSRHMRLPPPTKEP